MVCSVRRFTLITARQLGIAVLRVLVGVIQLVTIALAALIYVPAAILMLLIGLVSLAFMAVEDADKTSERGRGCADRGPHRRRVLHPGV
jgi:hypothetical protein